MHKLVLTMNKHFLCHILPHELKHFLLVNWTKKIYFFLTLGETAGEILFKKAEEGKWGEMRAKWRGGGVRSFALCNHYLHIIVLFTWHKRVSSMNEHFAMCYVENFIII